MGGGRILKNAPHADAWLYCWNVMHTDSGLSRFRRADEVWVATLVALAFEEEPKRRHLDTTTAKEAVIGRWRERGEQQRNPSLICRAMFFRLRHLTPGYFRLLQMQLTSRSESESEDRLINHLALLLAVMGLGLSYYSVRQMSKEFKPDPEP